MKYVADRLLEKVSELGTGTVALGAGALGTGALAAGMPALGRRLGAFRDAALLSGMSYLSAGEEVMRNATVSPAAAARLTDITSKAAARAARAGRTAELARRAAANPRLRMGVAGLAGALGAGSLYAGLRD